MQMDCPGGAATAMAGANNNNNNNNSSRWNPTKEQINMLENLYRQGVRTPSAEQIQQITSRLKTYGNIEGKNVFYWFQNHKARQRQKQKQESFACLNRYFHHSAVGAAQYPAIVYPPPSPNPNVVCGPYFIPQGEAPLGLHPQYPKVPVPTSYKRKLRREGVTEKARVSTCTIAGHDHHLINYSAAQYSPMIHTSGSNQEVTTINSSSFNGGHETLDLFPVHPTRILEDEVRGVSSAGESSTTSESSVSGFDQQPFFDFFSSQGSCCHRD